MHKAAPLLLVVCLLSVVHGTAPCEPVLLADTQTPTEGVAVSPDGRVALCPGSSAVPSVVDTRTNTTMAVSGFAQCIDVKFSPDGLMVAFTGVSSDTEIYMLQVFNVSDMTLLFWTKDPCVATVSFGDSTFVTSSRNMLCVWDAKTFAVALTMNGAPLNFSIAQDTAPVISPYGTRVAGVSNNSLYLEHLYVATTQWTFGEAPKYLEDRWRRRVMFSPDGQLLAMVTASALVVYNGNTGERMYIKEGVMSAITSFCPMSTCIAYEEEGGEVYVWDLVADDTVRICPVENNFVTGIALGGNGTMLVVGLSKGWGVVDLNVTSAGKTLSPIATAVPDTTAPVVEVCTMRDLVNSTTVTTYSLALSPSGGTVLVCYQGYPYVYTAAPAIVDAATNTFIQYLWSASYSTCDDVAYSPKGDYVVWSDNYNVYLLHATDYSLVHTFAVASTNSLVFSETGLLAAVSRTVGITVWDVASRTIVRTIANTQSASGLAFGADETLAYITYGTLYVVSARGVPATALRVLYTNGYGTVDYSPLNNSVVAYPDAAGATVWNTVSGRTLSLPAPVSATVVRFSPDGLVATANGAYLNLWRVDVSEAGGEPVLLVTICVTAYDIEFGPQGSGLMYASYYYGWAVYQINGYLTGVPDTLAPPTSAPPTAMPTAVPTAVPTALPTTVPTAVPSSAPTTVPSVVTTAPTTTAPTVPASTTAPATAAPHTTTPVSSSPLEVTALPVSTSAPATSPPVSDTTSAPLTTSPAVPATADPKATPTPAVPTSAPLTETPALSGGTDAPLQNLSTAPVCITTFPFPHHITSHAGNTSTCAKHD